MLEQSDNARPADEFQRRVVKAAAIVLALGAWVGALHVATSTEARAEAPSKRSPVQPRAGEPRLLRVCSDPNNLPFSNERGQGFENRIADIMAQRLGRKVAYTFWPQRRGFIRSTLKQNLCDVVIGIPAQFELTENTRPYYRSTYVFVTPASAESPSSLDDPSLRSRKIGVHVIGDDYSNPPPVEALARRGIVENVRGYSIYGDYSKPNPPQSLLAALDAREIDLAIAWGPLVGAFVKGSHGRFRWSGVTPKLDRPALAMTFAISMGVRHGDHELRAELDRALLDERAQLRAVLERFGVPLEPDAPEPAP